MFRSGLSACAGIILSLNALPAVPMQEEYLARGIIIDRVVCERNPGQSYALYLPSDFNPNQKWPILYAFDPGARGKLPLEHFREAADALHFIVAASNNARNGPWEPIGEAAQAIWKDTGERFPLDERRIYVTGFSGGARAASLFSRMIKHPVAGIIGCGAGVADESNPSLVVPSAFYGIVGLADFNYREMMLLDEALDGIPVTHYLRVFDGEHEWPPADVCAEALEWMVLLSMKEGAVARDDAFIKASFIREVDKASRLDESERVPEALSRHKKIFSLFKDLVADGELSEIGGRIERIKQGKTYLRYEKDEEARGKKELLFRSRFSRGVGQVLGNEISRMDLAEFFRTVGIYELQTDAGRARNPYDSAFARRLLISLGVNARDKGYASFEEGKYGLAVVLFEISAKALELESPRRKIQGHYYLACAYAMDKNAKSAIKNLELAVKNGFADRETIEKEPSFESIRKSPEYQELIKSLGSGDVRTKEKPPGN